METVTLNVGGTVFETLPATLKSIPNTRLTDLTTSCLEYDKIRKQYFFDRNPELFNFILDLYRTGSLHFPESTCYASIREELEFWKIPVSKISTCCLKAYLKYDKEVVLGKQIEEIFSLKYLDYNEKDCEQSTLTRMKRRVWLFLDQPHSSKAAKIFSGIFFTVVIVSYITFALTTLEDCRDQYLSDEALAYIINNNNSSKIPALFRQIDLTNPKLKMYATTDVNTLVLYTDYTCRSFFVIEFILHFLFCPQKCKFFCSALNILDLVLLVTQATTTVLNQYGDVMISNAAAAIIYSILHSLSILRIFRFFRLMKQNNGLRVLAMALGSSIQPMTLLLLAFFGCSVFFGNFMYYAELFIPDTFPNIFVGIWWAIVTMTTVGYGDTYPKSPFGCVVGTICATCGILILSMPIAMVATNFGEYFSRTNNKEKIAALRNQQLDKLFTRSKISAMYVREEKGQSDQVLKTIDGFQTE